MRTVYCLLVLMTSTPAFAGPQAGNWSITGSVFTNLFNYENDDARDELPKSIIEVLGDDDIRGDESDILNFSAGAGYYLTDRLHIGLTYTTGIEIGFLDDLGNLLTSGFDDIDGYNSFDVNMQMFAFDLRYRIYEMSESSAFFINGGAVVHRISANAENINDDIRTQIASTSESSIGAKIGAGFQWDFSNNWAVSLSYNHFTFMSIDNTSLMLEYRF